MGTNGNTTNNHFGRCLHELRLKADLNLHGLAQKINSSSAWLSYLESGQRVPSWELVENCVGVLKDYKLSQKSLGELKRSARLAILKKTFNGRNGK